MSRYAAGGYLAGGQHAHLDDDECVVHQDQEGWHCARALHQGQPCQSPSTLASLAQPEAEQPDSQRAGGPRPAATTTAAQPTPQAQPAPLVPLPMAHTHGQAQAGQGAGKAAYLASPTRPTR